MDAVSVSNEVIKWRLFLNPLFQWRGRGNKYIERFRLYKGMEIAALQPLVGNELLRSRDRSHSVVICPLLRKGHPIPLIQFKIMNYEARYKKIQLMPRRFTPLERNRAMFWLAKIKQSLIREPIDIKKGCDYE